MSSPTELAVLSLLYNSVAFVRQAKRLTSDDAALEYFLGRHTLLLRDVGASKLQAVIVNQGGSPEAAAIHLANAYANPRQEQARPSAGLSPIFQQVDLTGVKYRIPDTYPPRAFAEGAAYPNGSPHPAAHDDLARRFDERLLALAAHRPDRDTLLANLLGFLHEVAWCLPVPGVTGVSLYDHARLSAAITGVFGTLMTRHKPIDDERDALFMLVVGDMTGIQNHIYRIRSTPTGTGALAKSLRARSLEVALSAEVMARDILGALNLPKTQRIMSAGGKFYLLLPHDDATVGALTKVRAHWEQHSVEQGATLIPQLAWNAFTGHDFSHFQTVVQQTHRRLATAKLQPLSSQLTSPYLFGRNVLKPCAAYEYIPAEAGGDLSRQAQRDRAIGTNLPRVQALTFTVPAESSD